MEEEWKEKKSLVENRWLEHSLCIKERQTDRQTEKKGNKKMDPAEEEEEEEYICE